MRQLPFLTLAAATLALGAAAAAAGPLVDPTRPAIVAPATTSAGAPPGLPARRAEAAPAPAQPVLQAVHTPQTGAISALLDGQIVRVGDRIGERVVMAIDEHGLVLRGAGGTATERVSLLQASAAKQPVGSITVTRHASFTPAPSQIVEGSTTTVAKAPAVAAALSVAARTQP